jgi:tetratricopeptide (TPR) repeat protein
MARRHITHIGVVHGLESARGRIDEAVVALSEAARLGGDVPAWLEGCVGAVARLAASDQRACIEACDTMLAKEPDAELLWKLRGDAQRLAGDDPFESYDRALAVRRSYFEALYAKAEALLERGRFAEAREALQRALEIHPEFADAAALLARTHLVEAARDGDAAPLSAAIERAEEALRLDPRNWDATVALAEARIELARHSGRDEPVDAALGLLETARGLDGCLNHVNLLTARAHLERARQARAAGRDPRPQIEIVLELCRHQAATVSDASHWQAVRAEAQRQIQAR